MLRASSYTSASGSASLLLLFKGVVICCTGLQKKEKEECHRLVERYGGQYVRNFVSSQTTHLIAAVGDGEKYHQACQCPNVSIVTPTWIQQSISQSKLLPVTQFIVSPPKIQQQEKKKEEEEPDCWKQQLLSIPSTSDVFLHCRIYLVGFSSEEEDQLGHYIRLGKGLRVWDIELSLTHIIVHSQCSPDLRKAVGVVCQYHPNQPIMTIRPQWIIECLRQQIHLDPNDFPPTTTTTTTTTTMTNKTKTKSNNSHHGHHPSQQQQRKSKIFQGAVFLWSCHHPSSKKKKKEEMIFDARKMEQIILENGGLMALSPRVRQALQTSSTSRRRRVCFVIQMMLHNNDNKSTEEQMLCQWCDLVPVTPIWILSCVQQKSDISPTKFYPTWFQPQSYPFQTFHHHHPTNDETTNNNNNDDDDDDENTTNIRIAVTGFVGMERTAIQVLVTAMGATYTDTLTPSNTHLIVQQQQQQPNSTNGAKYRKAQEWNIHIVVLDWLHHILQYGYYGKNDSSSPNHNHYPQQGCEHLFSPTLPTNTTTATTTTTTNTNLYNPKKTNTTSTTATTTTTTTITDHWRTNTNLSDEPNYLFGNYKSKKRSSSSSEERLRSTLKSLETPLSSKNKNNTHRRVRRSPRRQLLQLNDTNNRQEQDHNDNDNDDNNNNHDEEHLNFSIQPTKRNKHDLNTNDSMIESQAIWYGDQTQYP